MSFAVGRKMRTDNPVRGVKRYADRKSEVFLSIEQLTIVGKALEAAYRNGANPSAIGIILLLALTGARKSEIASLRWRDIDFDRGLLRLADSKTGQKTIPVGGSVLQVLSALPAQNGSAYVFPASHGGRSFQGAEKLWRKVRVAAGFPNLRLHDLRHSFASVGLAQGDALPVIGAILGHADIKTTSRYAHLADDPVRQAAERISQTIRTAMTLDMASAPEPRRNPKKT